MIRLIAIAVLGFIIWRQQIEIRDMLHGLQIAQLQLDDQLYEIPLPPCMPCSAAIQNLQHPREQ